MIMYFFLKNSNSLQRETTQIIILHINKVFIQKFSDHLDYSNVCLTNLEIKLIKYNNINKYAIKLIEKK